MDDLWLLTEERPKPSVIIQIVEMYCMDFHDRIILHSDVKIKEYIYPEYSGVTVLRCISIFGGDCQSIPHEKVLFYLAGDGGIIINRNAPECIKQCVKSADNCTLGAKIRALEFVRSLTCNSSQLGKIIFCCRFQHVIIGKILALVVRWVDI